MDRNPGASRNHLGVAQIHLLAIQVPLRMAVPLTRQINLINK
jgi:hypothetical protein